MKKAFKDFLTTENAWIAFLILLCLLLIAFMFSGCSGPKQAAKKSNKLFARAIIKDRTTTAGNCANAFPYKETLTTRTETKFLPGEPIASHDTVTVRKDSLVTKYITTTIHKTDTIRKDSIVYKDSDGGPMLAQAQGLLEQATKDKQEAVKQKDDAELKEKSAKTARNIWMIIAIIETIIIIGPAVIKRFI